MKISTVEGTEAASAGDALRRIHELDVIRNDFILIQGDVISNLNLAPIVEAHKYVVLTDAQIFNKKRLKIKEKREKQTHKY